MSLSVRPWVSLVLGRFFFCHSGHCGWDIAWALAFYTHTHTHGQVSDLLLSNRRETPSLFFSFLLRAGDMESDEHNQTCDTKGAFTRLLTLNQGN